MYSRAVDGAESQSCIPGRWPARSLSHVFPGGGRRGVSVMCPLSGAEMTVVDCVSSAAAGVICHLKWHVPD